MKAVTHDCDGCLQGCEAKAVTHVDKLDIILQQINLTNRCTDRLSSTDVIEQEIPFSSRPTHEILVKGHLLVARAFPVLIINAYTHCSGVS